MTTSKADAAPGNRERPRLLLVDDDAQVRKSFGRVLSAAGYEVQTASDGQAATDALLGSHFDVVLSDVHMPGMDGLEMLRRVRERDLDVPVVLMTGAPSLETAIPAVEYGALRYLHKPIDLEELRKTIDHAVRLGRLAAAKREALALLGLPASLAGDRAGLEAVFRRALGSLSMAYQPIVSWSQRAIVGYEALLRSSDATLSNPAAILDAAERLDRTAELGRQIRQRVSDTVVKRQPGVDVFVNLHSRDLLDESLYLPDLALSRVAARIVLEVTERAPLDGVTDLRARAAKLREMGYRLAVDDLGAGYAGLASFAQLEPDVVKIDMSLVRDVHRNSTKRKLVSSIAGLCRDLEIAVVAEGVESPEERDVLVQAGCDLLQGYLFAKPGRPFPTAVF